MIQSPSFEAKIDKLLGDALVVMPGLHNDHLLFAINFLLIYGGSRALSERGNLTVAAGLFFAYLTTLIVVLYDTYRPVREARDRGIPEAKDQGRLPDSQR